jgi:hypothetical protein
MSLYNPQPKPVFVIRMPRQSSSEAMTVMAENVKENMADYHVLVVKDMWSSEPNIKFEVFNTDSFQQIEFDKLQKRLLTLATDTMRYEKF